MTKTNGLVRWRVAALVAAISGAGFAMVACGGGGSAPVLSAAGGATPGDSTSAGDTATTAAGAGSATTASGSSAVATAPQLGDCELFPSQAVFNTPIDDVSRFPAHPNSAAWIGSVGNDTPFRADWSRGSDPSVRTDYYGMPINVTDTGSARWAPLQFDFASLGIGSDTGYPHESDCAVPDGSGGWSLTRGCTTASPRAFPLPPSSVLYESGNCNDPASCGDHHVLVVERGACRLWEGYAAYSFGGTMAALSTAAWDLRSLSLRPANWTSADAAGLPITPFLAKAAEASTGEIRHALRVTFRDSALSRDFQWPARHAAGWDGAGQIPFGAVLRLRADFVVPDNWTPQARAIANAAKRYGLYVADIGMDFYVQGEPNPAWDPATFQQLQAIRLSQMEFVDLGTVTRDPRFSADSMAARW